MDTEKLPEKPSNKMLPFYPIDYSAVIKNDSELDMSFPFCLCLFYFDWTFCNNPVLLFIIRKVEKSTF